MYLILEPNFSYVLVHYYQCSCNLVFCDFQAPDMSSAEEFPTFGSGVAPKQTSAWGPKK